MNAIVKPPVNHASTDVEAVLNYTHKNGEIDARNVTIHDARPIRGLSLDVSGFEIMTHHSSLKFLAQFQDEKAVRAVDYPEVEAALRTVSGAEKVILFDHRLQDGSELNRRVQDDHTVHSAPHRVRKHLSPADAARRVQRRYAIVKFWRPIHGPVNTAPLAVCDSRTLEAADLLPNDRADRDGVGETYAVAYRPRHRWYWYPQQASTEATLLKIFDSASDGRARLTAHTSFDDPRSATGAAPLRYSIEVRALLFW